MKKKIYLHIGTHKTGTTSFQQLLRKNAQPLQAQNIYVPPVGKLISGNGEYQMHSGGLHLIASAFRGKVNLDVVHAYLEAFERSGCESACISSEGFDSLEKSEIDNLSVVFADYEIKILLVLRHPLATAKSSFCSRGGVSNFNNFDFLDACLRMRRFNYSSLINDYSCVGDLSVIKYEDFDNIVSVLYRSIGATENGVVGVAKKVRQSVLPFISIANQELYSALGVSRRTYLQTIYPYLIEFADNHVNYGSEAFSAYATDSPFPVDRQLLFMKEWVDMVFGSNCFTMQESRWSSWHEIMPLGKYVNPDLIIDFKEKFITWLFSEHFGKKKIVL
jgi:hypothetical protein